MFLCEDNVAETTPGQEFEKETERTVMTLDFALERGSFWFWLWSDVFCLACTWFSLCLDLCSPWVFSFLFYFEVLLLVCSLLYFQSLSCFRGPCSCLQLFLMCCTCAQSSCLPCLYQSLCFPLSVCHLTWPSHHPVVMSPPSSLSCKL